MEFDGFVREQADGLLRFATAVCVDRYLAEDVVQEVLIRMSRRWSELQFLDVPGAYARRAIVNEYLSWRRKWARLVPHDELPANASWWRTRRQHMPSRKSWLTSWPRCLVATVRPHPVLIRLTKGLTLIDSPAHEAWIPVHDALPH